MDPFGISAGASALGQGTTAAAGAYFQNQWATQDSRHARQFALHMSNTAYQRAVRDLRAAGLNPMLAYVNPASSPTAQMPHRPDLAGAMGNLIPNAVNTGRSIARFKSEQGLLEEQEKSAKSAAIQAKHGEEEAYHRVFSEMGRSSLLDQQALQSKAETSLAAKQQESTELVNRIRAYSIPGARAQAEFDATPAGQALLKAARGAELGGAVAREIGGAVGSFINPAQKASRAMRGVGTYNKSTGEVLD